MLDLYIIRHAESEGNLSPWIFWGRSNQFHLTEKGIRQSKALGRRLKSEEIKFDEVYSSSAVRLLETMKYAIPNYPRERIRYSENLFELDRGDWTGVPRKDILNDEIRAEMNRDSWNFRTPGGESLADVSKRVQRYLNDVIMKRYQEKSNGKDQKIAMFTHGYVTKTLITEFMGSDRNKTWRIATDNTSITQFRYDDRGIWWPMRINDAAHIYGI